MTIFLLTALPPLLLLMLQILWVYTTALIRTTAQSVTADFGHATDVFPDADMGDMSGKVCPMSILRNIV